MNNKLAEMIANGSITVEELAGATELIERAKLVKEGIEACKKTIVFHLGESSVNCYSYTDRAGEYEAWGHCTIAGTFSCSCNWGGTHKIGECNITNFKETFMAFENDDFAADLKRFLQQQINKVSGTAGSAGATGAR